MYLCMEGYTVEPPNKGHLKKLKLNDPSGFTTIVANEGLE